MADTHARHGGNGGAHHDDVHFVPERTTMQGSQEGGPLHGHELIDADVRQMLQATGWLAAVIALCLLVSAGFFYFLKGWQERREGAPSRLMAGSRVPPLPRLLPNPVDSPRANIGPMEFLADHLKKENATLDKLGLRDTATGAAKLPDAAVSQSFPNISATATPANQGPVIDGLAAPLPSDSSGGLQLENRLR
jgi:hypothetical protein